MNIDDLSFMKLQLSQGPLKDEEGKIIGVGLIFRPDIDVKEHHFFEYTGVDSFMC